MIVSITGPNEYKLLSDLSEPEFGSLNFSCPEELAASLSIESMHSMRYQLLGVPVVGALSKAEAAKLLWEVFLAVYPRSKEKFWDGWNTRSKLTQERDDRKQDSSDYELVYLVHEWGKDAKLDKEYCGLTVQHQHFMEVLCEDGRRIWTGRRTVELALDRLSEFNHKAGKPLAMIDGARVACCRAGLLKKLSYVEFLWDPKYRGLVFFP